MGFLDYCSHLSVCARTSSPDGFLKINAELWGWYMSHLENNWSQDNFEVIDIKTELAGDEPQTLLLWGGWGGAVGAMQLHNSPVPGVTPEVMAMDAVPPEGRLRPGQLQCLLSSPAISNMRLL